SPSEVEAVSAEGRANVLLSSDELDVSSGASKPGIVSDESTGRDSPMETIQKQLGKIGLKTGSHFQSITTKEGVGVEQFEAGSIVRHPTYGIGQVESIEGHGMRRMARISFDNGETKTFQLNKSPLQLIEA
ncbi:MAG: hypothetical protein KGQ60_17305, partial [Planctomycetes bacterium]|nr:hypothetical protein [Planctomycetota bacterium]